MPVFLAVLLLPLAVGLSFMYFLWVRAEGGNLEQALLISGVCVFVLTLVLEKYFPQNSQVYPKLDAQTDWISLAIILGLLEPLLKTAIPLMALAIASLFPMDKLIQGFWGHLDFVWQLLLVTLVIEFLYYWAHRWHHSVPSLWWLHALHHSPEKVYALNGFRLHPLNHLLNALIAVFPMVVLGAPAEALLGYLALSQPIIILQHANLALRPGLLNHLFSTNQVHRWHHSNLAGEGNTNFGRTLIMFDKLFGTFYLPEEGKPQYYGLFKQGQYPSTASYWSQVIFMFKPQCCKQA
jgi:ornithine lipid hydroxylase